ncbi:LytTR family DNA-binding domain-containing protein [Pseudooctadecabacter sp.]|uniref:LytTR family DNA-binding domain-containing protein n=1 Tax=Pseudooctadecabacter sp. TaxID=1966338 RepID=UPI0025FB99F0|nr:LytTR family DNA-binding domain-containing protein [Pseudooctadecabacter sp.]
MRKSSLGLAAAIRGALTPTIILGWLASSVVVAISGPFGTYETHGIVWRLAYWSVVIGVSIPIGILCRAFWEQVLSASSQWVRDLVVIASLALIFGPLVVGFNIWLIGPAALQSITWPTASLVTFCIGIGLVTVRRWIHDTQRDEPVRKRDRLLDRIGAPDGRRLAHVASDNHHIRICTDDGTEYRILMRLRDAIAEIDVEEGLCTHRSHWVALFNIDKVDQIAGKEMVVMSCGTPVPIGPKYRPDLINAGVFVA